MALLHRRGRLGGGVTAATGPGSGSLTVVGLGIQVPAHVTLETRRCIVQADDVLYLLADPVAVAWIEQENAAARPLHDLYEVGKPRRETYAQIVDAILESVRAGNRVCAAFYGHPGVCAVPSHEAVRRARGEGFDARMLAAVSAEACLIADLGIDPSAHGWQSYEATELLIYERALEPTAALIVWQIGVVGNMGFAPDGDTTRVPLLAEYLSQTYPPAHEVVLYEASLYPICGPVVRPLPLSELAAADISPMTTLYVPPLPRRKADDTTLRRLAPAAT